jgi:hypothetical protein
MFAASRTELKKTYCGDFDRSLFASPEIYKDYGGVSSGCLETRMCMPS